MRYAEDYYQRFPKVAIGHYPPLFYLVEGLWLIPIRNAFAILLLMPFLAASAGWLTWRAGRDFLTNPAAIAAAVVFCLLPLTRTYTAVVMADMLLVIFCLGAVMAFGKFLEHGRPRDSLWFGLLAAAAILTKGSGLFLALIPPIAIVLSRKFSLLRKWQLWIAPAPVLLFALPWILLTRHITAEGMKHIPISEYFPEALGYYSSALVHEFGWVILIAAAATLIGGFINAHRNKRGLSLPLSIHFATILGLLIFFWTVPSGFDARYLLPAAPAFALLVFALLPMRPATAAAVGFLCLASSYRTVTKLYTGASETIEAIQEHSDAESFRVLVASSPNGEGALTAAAALNGRDRFRIVRASKALAESDWLGRNYRDRFNSHDDLLAFFESESIAYLVIDGSIPDLHYHPYHALLQTVVENDAFRFSPVESIPSQRKVYGDAGFRILKYQTPVPRYPDSLDFDRD